MHVSCFSNAIFQVQTIVGWNLSLSVLFFLLKQYCLELRKRQLSQAILRFSWSFRFLNFFLFFKSLKAIAGAIVDLLVFFASVKIFVTTSQPLQIWSHLTYLSLKNDFHFETDFHLI